MQISDIIERYRLKGEFQKKELSGDDIQEVVRAALLAMQDEGNSAELYLADEPQLLQRLADSREHGAESIAHCAIAFAITADRLYDGAWVEHCSSAAWMICMQAAELGISYSNIQIRGYSLSDGTMADDVVRGILDIPEGQTVYSIVALGYAKDEQEPPTDDSLKWEKIHIK